MFNSITGILSGKTTDSLYIETQGIEWEIFVPVLALDRFGSIGDTVKIYVWLYHREDQMRLFGFLSPAQRALFFDLIKVDGIGPKQAVKILSGLDYKALETALDEGDVSRLQAIPGIGKKTAQKMVLALKGHLTSLQTSPTHSVMTNSEFEDLITALTDMGYERKRAAETVERLVLKMRDDGIDPAAKEQELFRAAIVGLSSG